MEAEARRGCTTQTDSSVQPDGTNKMGNGPPVHPDSQTPRASDIHSHTIMLLECDGAEALFDVLDVSASRSITSVRFVKR